MSLINCSHCNHKVSSDALICPNCSKPIQVLSDRLCENCNERLPKQKRKCPKCGHTNNTNSKSTNMANKNSNNILILLIVIVLLVGGYFYLNQTGETITENTPIETVIPDGTYRLTKERNVTSVSCNLSGAHFGKTIMISGKKAYTTVLQEMTYDIFNKGGSAFQIGPATATCIYSDNKLTFMCQGEEIVFERQ